MSKIKTGALFAAATLAAGAAGGLVGGGAAIALVRSAYNGPVQTSALPELVVNSEQLGEPVTLRVRLPLEYDSEPGRSFPVLWVLDGPSQGEGVARSAQVLARVGVSEPWIVVEVPSSSRSRKADFTPPWPDFTGDAQADRFHEFLRTEAIPAVEEAYRAEGGRVLVGHSLGGLFCLYALLRDPTLFDGYFVFSPSTWLEDLAIVDDLERAVESGATAPTSLFLSLGAAEGNRMLSGFEATVRLLDSWSDSGLRWEATITEDADHVTNPILSFPVALQWYSGQRGWGLP